MPVAESGDKAITRIIDAVHANQVNRASGKFQPTMLHHESPFYNVKRWNMVRNIHQLQARGAHKQCAFEGAHVKILGAKISGKGNNTHFWN